MVVYDPWYLVVMDQFPAAKNEKYLVFPASFAPDEPLEEVINAFSSNKSGLRLYITGNWKKAPEMRRLSSEKVIFAGFLPDSEYSALLAGSIAIITGTKQEYTVLMSAWEAVAYGKPLILSYSKTLKETFEDYPLYYHYDDPLSIKEIIDRAEDIQPDPRAREALLRKTMGSMDALKSALARW
jgi:glycosyltransferase involved in cell wall biosynthesis